MKAHLFLLCVVLVSTSAVCGLEAARPTPHLVQRDQELQARQLGLPGIGGSGTNDTTVEVTTTLTTTTPTSTLPITTSTTSSSITSSTSTRTTSSVAPTTTSTRPTASSASTVVVTSTLASGPSTSTDVASAATASSTSAADNDGNSHTGLIVGVSVVGGLALIGALIFLWMKFGGRRFSDYQDEDTDIKWPELKADGESAAMQPLPARRTGGAGFDMGNEFEEMRDTDGQSMAEYGTNGRDSMMDSSTALNTGVGAGAGAYGANMAAGSTYHDDGNSGSNHYAAPAYYDQYGGYQDTQAQGYYPDQGQGHGQYTDNYNDYQNQADPYDAARNQAASTSPQMQPYRSQGNHGMHQGY